MAYNYVTLTQARTDLAARLYDSGTIKFWSDNEKDAYIKEALRTWNSLTGNFRDDFVFPLVANTVWYDITNTTTAPNTLRPRTVTDVDIYKLIQYHFLEPDTGATWTGSTQFAINDLLQAVQRKRDEILSSTSCYITRSTVAAAAGVTTLNDSVIDIRRVAWIPDNTYPISPLWPGDIWDLQAYQNYFLTQAPGVPMEYRQSTKPPLTFKTDVDPAVTGNYELLTVNAEAALSTGAPSTFGIPDDFLWVTKFGAMSDLLNRDSLAKDALRSKYSNIRYRQGLAVLFNAPAVLAAEIHSPSCTSPVVFPRPLDIDSAQNTDNYRVGWQAETPTLPDQVVIAGLNLIGFAATPDSDYEVKLTVVQNAPVTSPIQIGRDDYDVILDYCVHLASFKEGGAEFIATIPLLQNFLRRAAFYNSKLNELGEYQKTIFELSQLQSETMPVYATATPDNVPTEDAE